MVNRSSNLIGSSNLCLRDFIGSRTSHKHICALVDCLFFEQTALFIWITFTVSLMNFQWMDRNLSDFI